MSRPLLSVWRAPLLRSLGAGLLALWGLATITFVVARLLPIDPVAAVVGSDAEPWVYAQARRELGLDRSLAIQYLDFLRRLLAGDLGPSLLSREPVMDDIWRVLPATLELGLTSTILGAVIGTTLGLVAALRQGSWPDAAIRLATLVGHSTPGFWKALLALAVFYAWLGWLPGPGRLDSAFVGAVPEHTGFLLVDSLVAGRLDVFRSAFAHLVMPVAILGISVAATFARFARTFALDHLHQDYIRFARLKGLSERQVVLRHLLPNMAVQLATVTAIALATAVEGAVLVETVFSWPGFGYYYVQALIKGDMNAVVGCTVVVGLAFVLANILADQLYRVLDPRVR